MHLIYDDVETDDDNDDEIDRSPDFHLKDKGSFTSHNTYTWYQFEVTISMYNVIIYIYYSIVLHL